MFHVYILRNDRDAFYVGQTNNLKRRLSDHISDQGAKFSKDNPGLRLVYSEQYETRAEAMRREKQLKKWSRAKKRALISGEINKLQSLSKNHQS